MTTWIIFNLKKDYHFTQITQYNLKNNIIRDIYINNIAIMILWTI